MPTFFEKTGLTEAQKTNWDAAIAEYKRIQEINLEYKFAHLSDEAREYYRLECDADTDEKIKEQMRALLSLSGNTPGHPKSALFARLLAGKSALPYPPPTSYSYPWYSIIENKGPQLVRIDGCATLGGLMKGTDGAKGEFSIGINQCSWAVLAANAAARTLLELQSELTTVAKKPDPNDKMRSIFEWTEDLLRRVKDAYAAKPEFTVQHGRWPEYRLFVKRVTDPKQCQRSIRYYAVAPKNANTLMRVGSAFDLDGLKINPRVGKTLSKGAHPKEQLDQAKARYAHLQSSANQHPFEKMLGEHAVDTHIKRLEKDVQDFEADPSSFDWVELFLDEWHLQKA